MLIESGEIVPADGGEMMQFAQHASYIEYHEHARPTMRAAPDQTQPASKSTHMVVVIK